MKHFLSLFTVLLFVTGLSFCMTSPSPSSDQSHSSVWKISKGDNALFLGGSIHVLRSEDFPLPGAFDRAYAQSKLLVLEADVDLMADKDVTQYLMSRMYLPEGQTLQSLLEPETYDMLREACLEYGFPIQAVSNMKPSMVITALSMFHMQKLGFVVEGVDAHYQNLAKKDKKPIGFLESVELQIDMLVSMGEGYEDDYVRYSLEDFETTDNYLAEIVAEWKIGGSSITEASLTEMKEEWPEMYKSMVFDRNAAWIPQIVEYHSTGAVPFIVVGAAHLHGPDGLLTQLKNLGYTVEQF